MTKLLARKVEVGSALEDADRQLTEERQIGRHELVSAYKEEGQHVERLKQLQKPQDQYLEEMLTAQATTLRNQLEVEQALQLRMEEIWAEQAEVQALELDAREGREALDRELEQLRNLEEAGQERQELLGELDAQSRELDAQGQELERLRGKRAA